MPWLVSPENPARRRGWLGTAECASGVRLCVAASCRGGAVCVQSVCGASPRAGREVSSAVGGGPL